MKRKIIILGGGVGGLSAGWMLARTGDYEITVVERTPFIGGACGTFREKEFLLDYGAHKAYSVLPGVLEELVNLMGDEFIKHEKRNSIFMFNRYLKYPISMTDLALKMGAKNLVQCGLSAANTLWNRGSENKTDEKSYEQYIVERFGKKLYRLVFEPLAEKVWGDPSTLSADLAKKRIPSKGMVDIVARAIGLKSESELTSAEYFYYPRQGFGRIPERMAEEIIKFGGKVLTDAKPIKIDCQASFITGIQVQKDGALRDLSCDLLISSIPLHGLAELLQKEEEKAVWKETMKISSKLQYRNAMLVYIFLSKEMVTDQHWIFFPEKDIIFSRVFEQKQMNKEMCPKDRTVLCCDFTDDENGPLWNQTDSQLAETCISGLEKIGMIRKASVEKSLVKRLPKFYPRYDLSYKKTVSMLHGAFKKIQNMLLTGRVGFYNYNNCDHCVDMGKFIADRLKRGEKAGQIWTELEKRVEAYKIVD